jgi:hypothetical protein
MFTEYGDFSVFKLLTGLPVQDIDFKKLDAQEGLEWIAKIRNLLGTSHTNSIQSVTPAYSSTGNGRQAQGNTQQFNNQNSSGISGRPKTGFGNALVYFVLDELSAFNDTESTIPPACNIGRIVKIFSGKSDSVQNCQIRVQWCSNVTLKADHVLGTESSMTVQEFLKKCKLLRVCYILSQFKSCKSFSCFMPISYEISARTPPILCTFFSLISTSSL